MALEIITIGGIDIVAQIFNAIAAMTSNASFFSLMGIAEVLGVVACVYRYIQSRDLKTMGIWMLFFVFINGILLTPKVDLLLTDKIKTTTVKKVDNVPLGVALPYYLFSLGGNSLAELYDTFLSQPNDVQYTRTGMLFGQRLLDGSFYTMIKDSRLESNISEFTEKCIVPDIEINGKYTYESVFNSKNLYADYFKSAKHKQSENRHISYSDGKASSYITCLDASKKISADIDTLVNNKFKAAVSDKYKYKLNLDPTNVPSSTYQSVYGYLNQSSASATDIYKQNLLVNKLRRDFEKLPSAFDGSADMIANTAEQAMTKTRLANLASYQVASKTLPNMFTVFSVLLVGIFPVIVLAMFVTELTMSIIKSYMGFLFSLMLYPVLFAIFNSIVNTLTYQQLGGESFTISNADTMKSNLADLGSTASYLMMSIPFISFGLIKGLGQAVSSAGSYLGNALSSATSADASQISMGNYNFGNMQMQNVNGFKTDLNSAYRVGTSSIQKENGAIEHRAANGSFSYDAATSLSKLPFSVNWSEQNTSSFNERTTMSVEQRAMNSQGVRQALTMASSHLSGHNSGGTTTRSSGDDLVDTRGYQRNDARTEHDKVSDSDKVSNESNVNTVSSTSNSAKSQAGFGVDVLGANVGGSIEGASSTAKSEKDNKAVSAMNDIVKGIDKGLSISAIKGLVNQHRDTIMNSSYATSFNNFSNEFRQAEEKYNDYVESESKSLAKAKEAMLSNSKSETVTNDLNTKVYQYIKENYSESEQDEILNAAPSARGMALRQEAVKAVSSEYVDGLISSYRQNAQSLSGEYQNTSIANTAGNPTDINPNTSYDLPNNPQMDRSRNSEVSRGVQAVENSDLAKEYINMNKAFEERKKAQEGRVQSVKQEIEHEKKSIGTTAKNLRGDNDQDNDFLNKYHGGGW